MLGILIHYLAVTVTESQLFFKVGMLFSFPPFYIYNILIIN